MEQNMTDFFNPPFDVTEEENIIGPGGQVRRNTIQEEFSRLIGRYVVGEFLIGTNGLYIQDGILAGVGENVIILYDPQNGTYTSCDLFAIKFLTYFPKNSPVMNLPEEQQQEWFNRVYQQRVERIAAFNAAANPVIPAVAGQERSNGALAWPGAMPSRPQQSMQQGTGRQGMGQPGMPSVQPGMNQQGWQTDGGQSQRRNRQTHAAMPTAAVPVMQVLE